MLDVDGNEIKVGSVIMNLYREEFNEFNITTGKKYIVCEVYKTEATIICDTYHKFDIYQSNNWKIMNNNSSYRFI